MGSRDTSATTSTTTLNTVHAVRARSELRAKAALIALKLEASVRLLRAGRKSITVMLVIKVLLALLLIKLVGAVAMVMVVVYFFSSFVTRHAF